MVVQAVLLSVLDHRRLGSAGHLVEGIPHILTPGVPVFDVVGRTQVSLDGHLDKEIGRAIDSQGIK